MKRIVLFLLLSISFFVGAATTTTYDFSVRSQGVDIFAYEGTPSTQLPTSNDTPSSQLSSSDYDFIEINNNTYHDLINYTKDLYPALLFVVELDEAADDVTELNVFWNGFGSNSKANKTDGVLIYIWNSNSNSYDLLTQSTRDWVEELEQSVTSNITDYIDSNNQVAIYIVSQEKTFNNETNWIGTDYFSLSVTADSVVVPAIPIVDYRFDECTYTGSGFEVIDQTGNYNAGINGVNTSATEAQINSSLDFSATSTDDWLTVPSGVIDGLDDLTLSVWVNVDNSYSQQEILHALGSSTDDDELEVYLNNDSNVYVKVQDVGTTLEGNITITDGTWHHILLTRANDQVCLYVDDQFQDCDTGVGSGQLSVPDASGIVIGQEQDSFGGLFDSGQSFEGLMDEFKIYDQVLSSTEITSLYTNEFANNNYDGTSRDTVICDFEPIAEYRFEETSYSGVADEVIDETGNFNAIAVNGVTTDGALPALSTNPGTCRYGSFNDNYVALPDSFENLQGSFTITAWINPSNLNSGSRIFADDELNQTGYAFSLGDPGNGKLRFYSRGVSPVSVDTTTSIIANEWTFVTAVHNSANKTRQIYINGEPQIVTGGGTSNTYSGTWGTDTGVATIGGETESGESGNRFTGSIDEVRVYESALSESEIMAVFAETHPCEVIHHFEINHDAQGLTCVAEPLTIKACSDEACTVTIATSTDVQIFANGVLKTTVTVTGETATEFNHLVEETITLSSDQTYTCNNVNDTSCDISFANAGFLLDVNTGADVSSCESVNFEIKAVKLSDSGVSCAPAFTGSQDLDFSFSYSNPISGAIVPVLNGTNMAISGASETRTIVFDANGEASLPIEYDDAGTLSFTLSENVSSGVSSGTINKDFIPSNIFVTAKKDDGTPLTNATSDGTPKQVAADTFDLSFSGQCSGDHDNTETPNYKPQSTGTVELAVRHIAPSSVTSVSGDLTVEGTLINATDSANTDWQSINTTEKELVASYSEVGVVSISIKDTDYLGNEINTLDFIDVGRFYPSYFDVSITHNSFENTGTAGTTDFTYIGQPFGY
ncbi:MAG: MSHA biogenesis protein MshQ, partial [Colwellia sp.]